MKICAALSLAACGALQPGPRQQVYDFGPGILEQAPAARAQDLPPLVLSDVQVASALDSTAVLYRLAYSDAQQLRPYALARWSMPPAELLQQRLRAHLGQHRVVLRTLEANANGGAEAASLILAVELDEFSQLFSSAEQSSGLVRLRATLGRPSHGVVSVVAQRSLVVQRASSSPDAVGGVRALTLAADGAIQELDQWILQTTANLAGK